MLWERHGVREHRYECGALIKPGFEKKNAAFLSYVLGLPHRGEDSTLGSPEATL